jgi:hypothetical protein
VSLTRPNSQEGGGSINIVEIGILRGRVVETSTKGGGPRGERGRRRCAKIADADDMKKTCLSRDPTKKFRGLRDAGKGGENTVSLECHSLFFSGDSTSVEWYKW